MVILSTYVESLSAEIRPTYRRNKVPGQLTIGDAGTPLFSVREWRAPGVIAADLRSCRRLTPGRWAVNAGITPIAIHIQLQH
jgi:hypothetical protein